MLRVLKVRGFKSLVGFELEMPKLGVLLGPNAAGKSNILDAIQALSRLATEPTLADALSAPIRGYPQEAFTLPAGGLPALMRQQSAQFTLEADLEHQHQGNGASPVDRLRYRVTVRIHPATGALVVEDEYLARLTRQGEQKGSPAIERTDTHYIVRPKGSRGRPWQEPLNANHTLLSDPRLSGYRFPDATAARADLATWRTYYLDPRVAMRSASPPKEVRDIGPMGENLAPFLHRLKHGPYHDAYQAVVRTVGSIVPSIQNVDVDLDPKRGELDIQVEQGGTLYSSRVISEGTLRVLALCAVAANPWPTSLVAFEEPENGVHPARVSLISHLLVSMALESGRQVLVTTHSPLLAASMLRWKREHPSEIGVFACRQRGEATTVEPLPEFGALYENREIMNALSAPAEEQLIQSMYAHGWIDG